MGPLMSENSYVAEANYSTSGDGEEPPSIQPLACRRLGTSKKRRGSGRMSPAPPKSGAMGGFGGAGTARGGGTPPHRSASAPSMYAVNGTGNNENGTTAGAEMRQREQQWPQRQRDSSPSPPSRSSGLAAASLRRVQNVLDFKFADEERHWQFAEKNGLGRVATLACILGLVLGTHFTVLLLLCVHNFGLSTIGFLDDIDPARVQLLQQWLVYVALLSFFHIAEFFVTAIWNPAVTSADSFVVNQSLAYTAAALVSWVEFWARFAFFPSANSATFSGLGLGLVLMGQACRTLAMVTCGQSFNHVIQLAKKDSHQLVTQGIYRYLRHPSYFGFYWWSVGTQLLLGNPVCTVCYAAASWYFFKQRIPYEELTLLRHFPNEYPRYAEKSWIGIPFIRSSATERQKDE